MKKLILLLLMIPLLLIAQEPTESQKQKEIAILFRNLENFGLSYRCGKAEALWRIDLLSFRAGESNFFPPDTLPARTTQSYNFGLQLGREYRKSLNDKVELRYGFGISGRYGYSIEYGENVPLGQEFEAVNQSLNAGIIGILGINYFFNPSLALGIEVNPQLTYRESWGKVKYESAPSDYFGTATNTLLSFDNQVAMLSLTVVL